LNLRPPGYEPGELPDCSTPRRGDKDSIGSMPWWTWIALVFFVVVAAGGGVVTVMSLRRMRDLQATSNHVVRALDEVTSKAEALEARLELASERAELLERKMAHLQTSLDRLAVLAWAIGDVGKTIAEVRRTVTLRK
jgi:hypothetical protein